MNSELQQLKDIHLPKAIAMWPIASGWIFLYLLLLSAVCCTLWFWYRKRKKQYIAKVALAQLKKLQQLANDKVTEINFAAEISTLLRRTALYYFPRKDIAGLSGQDWLSFLNRSGNTEDFNQKVGELLTDAPYQKKHSADVHPLFDLAHAWIVTIANKKRRPKEK